MLTLALCSLMLSSSPQTAAQHQLWQAHLNVAKPGDEHLADLNFGLDLVLEEGRWSAFLINEPERIPVPQVTWDGKRLVLNIDHYDSRIEATLNEEGVLEGHWKKVRGKGKLAVVPFWATQGQEPLSPKRAVLPRDVGGRWAVDFGGDEIGSVGIFKQSGSKLTGTFLNATGDFRFLAGNVQGKRMKLSCFDGAHAFLFEAEIGEDGELSGSFRSGNWWLDDWTARRDASVQMTNAFDQTTWDEYTSWSELNFLDEEGRLRSLIEPGFMGRATIIQLFGTWCPNCHDETRYLVELHERYASRGLHIVGLAFELEGHFERDAKQLEIFRERHKVPYPMLLAGTANKAEASLAFPAIDRLRSFPTSIFVDSSGRVRGLHSGFAGPATGEEHSALRARYEAWIESLLSEEPAPLAGALARLDGSTWHQPGGIEDVRFKLDAKGQLQATYQWSTALSTPPIAGQLSQSTSPVSLRGDALWFGGKSWRLDVRTGSLSPTRRFGTRLFELGAPAREVVRQMAGAGENQLMHLIQQVDIDAGDPTRRVEALLGLARLEVLSSNSEALLLECLQDASHRVRVAALWAAGLPRLSDARPALIKHLEHPNATERREAVSSLIRLGAIPKDVDASWPELKSMADPLVREMLAAFPELQR